MSSVVTENFDSQNRDNAKPKPGDLIEISYYAHKHWAVYVGDGYVVHLTSVGTGSPGINVVHFALGKYTRGVVRKELLTTVAAGYKYKVNNKHDEKKLPLCAEKIVQRAEAQVGKEMPYNFKKYNCEHFATEMRYEVPLTDKRRIGSWPKPGDMIEIFHKIYQHWAVYVGDGYVVHLTGVEHGVSGIYHVGSGSGLSVNAMVKKEPLTKVTAGCKYRVNNKYDKKIKPLPAKKIVHEAEKLVGKVINYNLITNNCEHFATKLRYEDPRSGQVWKKMVAGIGLTGLGIIAIV